VKDVLDNLATQLGLSSADRQVLYQVGADSPLALLAALEAAPQEYAELLGSGRYQGVLDYLNQHLSTVEQKQRSSWLAGSPEELSTKFHFGALLTRPPRTINGVTLSPADSDVTIHTDFALRDRLFEELEELRRKHHLSSQEQDRLDEVQSKLSALLDETHK
jgi:hypothetical protein